MSEERPPYETVLTDAETNQVVEDAVRLARTDALHDACLAWTACFRRWLKQNPRQAQRLHELGGGGAITFCAGYLAGQEDARG